MKRYTSLAACLVISLSCLLALSQSSTHSEHDLIVPGAVVEKVAGGFSFTEGPAADAQGNVYFTDQPNDRIMKWSVEGQLSTFLEPSGRSNGLYFDHDGDLLACADEENELWSISSKGEVSVLVEGYQNKRLNGPNDLWVSPDGGIYFTDPYYKRPYWNRGEKEMEEHVYYIHPDRETLTRVADGLVRPNGIIGTPDGKLLYVADIGDKKTYVYEIAADGRLENRRLFCEMGSDGMTIDEKGNIYLTGEGVSVFNSSGEKVAQIDVPESWTANVTFGGREMKTLFITASRGLYTLEMTVRGGNLPGK